MNNKSGQSLFEVILSLAIISIIIITLISLASNSIRNTTFSKNKTLSSRLAQEAVEWIRGERDASWTEFFDKVPSSNYCLQNLEWTNTGICSGEEFVQGTILTRNLTLTSVPPSQVRTEVEVSWEDSQGQHTTRVVTDFTNWQGN